MLHTALALSLAVTLPISGQDARQIMEESQRRTQANSQHYEGLLQVVDSKGQISDKRWVYDRVGSHGRSRSVLTFVQPAEVKGVALLVVNFPDRASDQWMWTPAIQRERRIALQDRSTRFFGTDFSFEDLEERDTEQYDYAMLGDESVDGVACWKIQSRPRKGKSSQYTSSISLATATLVASSASATRVSGWDFSQYAGDGFMSVDGGGSFTNTLDANYSDLDPTFGARAEAAPFGRMYVNGQYGSTNVAAGSSTEQFLPSAAVGGSLSSNLTAPGGTDFDSFTVLASEGQLSAESLAMIAAADGRMCRPNSRGGRGSERLRR